MTRWLQSGRRRDICVLLADAGELPSQKLKTRLERHYDVRLDPQSFYGVCSAMEDQGLIASRTEGVTDVYSLTDDGEARLRDHYEWMRDSLAEA